MGEREPQKSFFFEKEKGEFEAHVADLTERVLTWPERYPLKVVKYARLARAGLPLDWTVRYYPGEERRIILERVAELTSHELEVWVSFAPPDPPGVARRDLLTSAQTTDLFKDIALPEDFVEAVFPLLDNTRFGKRGRPYPEETWVKTFYDSHDKERETISGSLSFSLDSQGETFSLWNGRSQVLMEVDFTPDIRQIHSGELQGAQFSLAWQDGVWRHQNSRDERIDGRLVTEPLALAILEKVTSFLGPQGSNARGLERIARWERRPSLDFEFKIRPGDHFLPFFLIDYEFGGPMRLTAREKRKIGGQAWFYRRQGD